MREIEIIEYQETWASRFAKEAELISSVIGFLKPTIHHIGSTSVPGLAAKPIIDILREGDDVNPLDGHSGRFESIGYHGRGELGIAGRRFYQKVGDIRSHQIHAFKRDHFDVLRHLAFREYLVNHPEEAQDYAVLKKKIAQSCGNGIDEYCAGKDKFVKKHERLAVEWYAVNKQRLQTHSVLQL
jgi:GrpB-like predicted nucleotidyltransferase (UPF0157 family)